MEIKNFIGDALLEKQGKWVPLEDSELLIASNQSPAYRAALKKSAKRNARAFQTDDEKVTEPLIIEAMADHILLDWKGMNWNGKPFEYNRENAIKLLAIPAIRDFVSFEAQKVSNFVRQEEDGAKADLKSEPTVEPQVGG